MKFLSFTAVMLVAAGYVSADDTDNVQSNAQCAQSSCSAQMSLCIMDPGCSSQFPHFVQLPDVTKLPSSMSNNKALASVAKCLETATCVVRRAVGGQPSIKTSQGTVSITGKDVAFSLESCDGVGSMCELAKAIETNLAAVATATQAASDAKTDATAKDAALKKDLLSEIAVLKEAVTNDLSGRMSAVEQDMKDAAKANTKLQQDLKATVDGDLGKATKQIIDLQNKVAGLTASDAKTSAKNDALQKSVTQLEEASKCSFRGKLNKDGKKCTCSTAGYSGDFCELKDPESCKEVLDNNGSAKDGLYKVKGKVVYCIMDKKWSVGGGWQVWTMFGDTGDFGPEVSKTTRNVRIKQAGGFPTTGQGNINNKLKSFKSGWSAASDYVWNDYCNAGGGNGKKYMFDFHDSGPTVGEVYLTLPSGYTEFATKFGNCYGGCSTVLYQANSRIAKKDGCGGSKRNCFTTKTGSYSVNNNNLKWREQDGTCVGSIFWVLVR